MMLSNRFEPQFASAGPPGPNRSFSSMFFSAWENCFLFAFPIVTKVGGGFMSIKLYSSSLSNYAVVWYHLSKGKSLLVLMCDTIMFLCGTGQYLLCSSNRFKSYMPVISKCSLLSDLVLMNFPLSGMLHTVRIHLSLEYLLLYSL